jgi:uncharacterized protein (DUF2062 family)
MKLSFKGRYKKAYLWFIRLLKKENNPECVARGVALGLFAAFMVPIGTHTVTILLLGFLFRCNKIVAMSVTFLISNEITIPFIYPAQCILGGYLMADPLSFEELKGMFIDLCTDFSFDDLFALCKEVGVPYLVGGALFSALSMPPAYLFSLSLARKLKARHEEKLRRRQTAAAALRMSPEPDN